MVKLDRDFYLQDTLTVAKSLLGKYIVHEWEGGQLMAQIVETEGYIGSIDKACHAYQNKRTQRTEILFYPGGHLYVYLIYGMYYCMNVVTEKKETPCAVLIRGCIPVSPLQTLSQLRFSKPYDNLTNTEKKNFFNGPGKICKGLGISKAHNGIDLLGDKIYICKDETEKTFKIETGKRINIHYAEEAVDFLWRFFIR